MSDEVDNSLSENASEALLNALEARVLGTLMEKQLTTPDQYPLTLNSSVTGCNQKTSREPVSNYNKGEIEHCLNQLRERKLIEVEYGSRVNRFDQRLSRTLFLDKPAQTLITIMLLRGPQTVNELLNRTERMTRWETPEAIIDVLNTLCQKTSPMVLHIPRQTGQREDRYMHLLCGQPDLSAWASASSAPTKSQDSELLARVEQLEQQLSSVIKHLGLDEID